MTQPRGIYVVSKVSFRGMWQGARRDGADIISSWIDDVDTPDFTEAWPRYLREVVSAQAVVVYVGDGELKGGLLEIGAALGAGIPVWVYGLVESIPALKTARHHPLVHHSSERSLGHLLARLTAEQLMARLA